MALLEGLREGAKLDAKSTLGYAWLIAALNVASLAYLLITSRSGIDTFGHLLGSDFLSFWAAGRMLDTGVLPYDAARHLEAMKAFAPSLQGYPSFWYPPLFLLLCAPLGLLAYFPALVAWLLLTGIVFVLAVRLWVRKLDLAVPLWLWLAAFPPLLITITHGQTSFLVAALLGAGLLVVKERPILAGVLLGLATIKPQFGLLVPIALLLTGSWRTIIAASVTTATLALLTTVFFGPEVWNEWLALSGDASAAMEGGVVGYGKMISPFAAMMLLGSSSMLAYAVQSAVTVMLVAAVAWVSWRRQWSAGLAALLCAGAPLATPFVLDYDLTLLAFPLIYLAATGYRDWEKTISALAFAAPIFARPLAISFGFPIMPVALALLFWVLWRRAHVKSEG